MPAHAEDLRTPSEADPSLADGEATAQGIGCGVGLAVGAAIVFGPEKAGDHASVTPPSQQTLDVRHAHKGHHSGTSPGPEAMHQLVEAGTLAGTMALVVFVATAVRVKWLQHKKRTETPAY